MVNPFAPPESAPIEERGEAIAPGLTTEPYSFGRILSVAWTIWVENLAVIAALTAAIYVPINGLVAVVQESRGDVEWDPSTIMTDIYLGSALEVVFGVLLQVAISFIVARAVAGRKTSLGEAFSLTLSRWGSALGASILSALAAGVGLVFLVLPGIYLAVRMTFAINAAALRDEGAADSLAYSGKLVEGQWWKVFGFVFLLFVLASMCHFGVSAAGTYLPESVALTVLLDTVGDVAASFTTVASVVLFLNLDGLRYGRLEELA